MKFLRWLRRENRPAEPPPQPAPVPGNMESFRALFPAQKEPGRAAATPPIAESTTPPPAAAPEPGMGNAAQSAGSPSRGVVPASPPAVIAVASRMRIAPGVEGADRLRAAHISALLQVLGLNPDALNHGARFMAEFSSVAFPDTDAATAEIHLRYRGGDKVAWSEGGARFGFDVASVERYQDARHIYINAMLFVIKSVYGAIDVFLDLDSIDPYMRSLRDFEVARALQHNVGLFNYFGLHNGAKEIQLRLSYPRIALGAEPRSYPRPGMVELTTIRNMLVMPEQMESICRRIMDNWDSEEYLYAPRQSQDPNVPDFDHSVRHLITNAGMYATSTETLVASLHDWMRRYLDGLGNGHELYVNYNCVVASHVVRAAAIERGIQVESKESSKFGSLQEFYDLIAGKKVLLISPFALACEHAVDTGKVRRMWKHLNVPAFELTGLRAFVTTYPNRPHASWSESFAVMCRQVDKILSGEKYDLVLGSCGCYGVPLMDYCYTQYGVSSIYYGNITHMLFGVRLNDFASHFDTANLDEWVDPFWGYAEGPPANLERIESGRYVAAELGDRVS